jgi:hypothetical protein
MAVTSEEIEKFAEKLNKKGKPITTRVIMEHFNISKHAASKHLHYLEEKGVLICVGRGKAGAKEYILKKFLKRNMVFFLRYLKEKYCRNLTINEIAYEYGESPTNKLFKNKVYKYAKIAGCTTLNPSKKEIERGQCRAYLNLTIAALLKLRKNKTPKVQKFFEENPFYDIISTNELEKKINQLKKANPPTNEFEKLYKQYIIYKIEGVRNKADIRRLIKTIRKRAIEYAKKFKELLPRVEIIEMKELGTVDVKFSWPEEASRVIGEVNEENGKKPCHLFII